MHGEVTCHNPKYISLLKRFKDRGNVSKILSAAAEMVSENVNAPDRFACLSYHAINKRVGKLVNLQNTDELAD